MQERGVIRMRERCDGWELKKKIKTSGVFGYEIAEVLHITPGALSKQLRNPTREQAAEIVGAIKQVQKKKAV